MKEKLKAGFGAVLLLAITGFIVWYFGPDIKNDYFLQKDKTVEANDYSMSKGECTIRKAVLFDCTIIVKNGQKEKEFHYMFFGTNRNVEVQILKSATNPELITTSVGIEYFQNRILTFLGLVGLLGGLAVLALFKVLFGRKAALETQGA